MKHNIGKAQEGLQSVLEQRVSWELDVLQPGVENALPPFQPRTGQKQPNALAEVENTSAWGWRESQKTGGEAPRGEELPGTGARHRLVEGQLRRACSRGG